MPDIWFFLSYARHDRETDKHNCISRFYEDLDERVRGLKKVRQGTAGFFDGQSIQQGDAWPESLAHTISICRVLICMYSPAYFDSEYCGKEWAVFNSRVKAFYEDGPAPLILPILFYAPEDVRPLPAAVSHIQFMDDLYPEVYRREGLRYMMVRNNQEDNYQDFLDRCVEKLMEAADKYPLDALNDLPDIKQVSSAFHAQTTAQGNNIETSVNVGPRYADFIYVAARREEIERLPVKPRTDRYGDEGQLDWKPYLPPDEPAPERDPEVWSYGQFIANRERFRYQRIPLNENLVEYIREAQRDNRIVVIIVDTWTLCLKQYWELMQAYDRELFWNSVVLVAWNKDGNPDPAPPMLSNAVKRAFTNKTIIKDERYFVDSIYSSGDLESVLSIALQRLKMQIIDAIQVFRQIGDGPQILKPELSGPGGGAE